MSEKENPPQLPSGWTSVSLKEVSEISSGYGFPKRYQGKTKGEIPFFKVKDISRAFLDGNIFLKRADNYVSLKECNELNAKPLREGTIVFAKIGEAIKLNRRVILEQVSLVDNNVMGVYAFPEVIDNLFTFYFLLTIQLGKYSRATTVPSVRKSDVEQIKMLIPPFPEQKRIVSKIEEIFTRLDAGVKSLKKIKNQLKRYRQAVLKYAFRGKLTERDPNDKPADELMEQISKGRRKGWEDLYERKGKSRLKYKQPSPAIAKDLPPLPKEWKYVSADEISVQITDGEHLTPKRTESGVYLLSARNVLNGELALDDVDFIPKSEYERLSKRLDPEPGDVLLTCSGSVGRTCVVPPGLRFSMVRSVALLKPVKKLVSGKFMCFALRSDILQNQIEEKKTQTAQSNIFQGKIRTLAFPLAPLNEQGKIVEEIESRFSMIDKIEKATDQCLLQSGHLRQSVLKSAFSGRLVANDPSDEPAWKLLERIKKEKK